MARRTDSMNPLFPNDSPPLGEAGEEVTPTLARYLELKAENPDSLLFYRMGDFYELFFDDAVQASAALGITLTRRGKYKGADIPLAGVPLVTAENYLARLIRAGFKVAIAEQTETVAEAKKRGAKASLKREVVRLITPGTITEETLLEPKLNNYLVAVAETRGQMALSGVELSTGQFFTETTRRADLAALLQRLEPSEILLPESLQTEPEFYELWQEWRSRLTILPNPRFDYANGLLRLQGYYDLATLDGLGSFIPAEVAAAGTLLDYLALTQKNKTPRLERLRQSESHQILRLDPATARSLELTRSLGFERRGTLLSTIDRTVTAGGARLLFRWLTSPLTDRSRITARSDAIGWLKAQPDLTRALRDQLRKIPDLERPLSRLALGRGGPRDLGAIRAALQGAAELKPMLSNQTLVTAERRETLPELLSREGKALLCDAALMERLSQALAAELPLVTRDGGVIAAGYSVELDNLRYSQADGRKKISDLQARYSRDSGISNLKIKFNNIIGYFIEVNPKEASRLPPEQFRHRQTMAGAARFTSDELQGLERGVSGDSDRALAMELRFFEDLVTEVVQRGEVLARLAEALAHFDLLVGLATLAMEQNYCCPEWSDEPIFIVEGGRHPVVEIALRQESGDGIPRDFIANDCSLDDQSRLWLLTGPNMAGKSTFLRQNALMVILAQMGSFVPAQRLRMGIVDRLFSRVGASDDLARGRSTFMVEMIETATILNQATEQSLVILDEIGRGTATFDGLSIAWASLEHLHHVNRCRTLFATHYHELDQLRGTLPQLSSHRVLVQEWQGKIIFLHQVVSGGADRSYGIHVARLAGLPEAVVARAETVLHQLESQEGGGAKTMPNLPNYQAAVAEKAGGANRTGKKLLEVLETLTPDHLSPRDALEALYRLKQIADGG
ncbi:MAG: DNA mismatch repair protein MutS [Candidatus Pacebacteria bacterium]|nr:DNA mismatch repair protein MutS [Candidatus Paceibacterota bacterium]